MTAYLLIAIGGGIGAVLRHAVNRASLAYLGAAFPHGTLFVNVFGSLLMGIVAGIFLARGGISEEWRLFLTTGILGGFTTFSAFSFDAGLLWQRGDYEALTFYITASVILSIAALFAGMAVVKLAA